MMLKLIRNRAALVLAGLVAALCPMLMAPSGGIPPVLTLRQINVTAGSTAAASLLQPALDQTLYSILGRNQAGPGLQCRWDSATAANRQCAFGIYDNAGVFSANFSPTSNGVAGESARVLGDVGGNATRSYIGLYDNAGARQGYFGKTVNGTGDLFWESDGGDLKLIPLATTGRARISIDGGATFSEVARMQTGSFTITGNGFTANPTATATYSVAGGVATIFIPVLTGTSNATTFNLTGIPAAIQPATLSPIVVALVCSDNGTIFGSSAAPCTVKINAASGTWNVLDAGANLWTGSGIKAVFNNMGGGMTLSYPLN